MKKIYTSIDIGTYSIKIIVGEYYNSKLHILAVTCVESRGVKKGLIVDANLAISSIKKGISKVNEMLGIDIKKVIVNVPDYNAKFKPVSGCVDIRENNNIITSDDINRVIKDSVYNMLEPDYELVTVIPTDYFVDDNEIIGKPVGKSGQKLEIKGIMISTPKKNVYSVLGVVEAAGLEVVDITISGLSDYYEVRNDNLDKKFGALIDLGHETTTVSIFENGNIVNNEILQIGGINVEKDLSYVFGISMFDGRILKEKFASSHKRFCQLNEIYEVKNTIGEVVKLNQLEVSEVTMSRMIEILNLAKKQIRKLTDEQIEYVVLTGGLTEIKSFKNLTYEIFGKDVVIYNVTTLGARDNKYTTSLGMIKYFIYKMESRGRDYSMFSIEDETSLIAPNGKLKKDNTIVNKIFGSFIAGKEDNNG
jgi:cell division protein FtsA